MRALPRHQRGSLRALLGWILVAALIFAAYRWSHQREQARRDGAASLLPTLTACADPFPSAGPMTPPPTSSASRTRFVNHTAYDWIIDLGPEAAVAQRLAVPAGASVEAPLPTGVFPWRLRRGAAWCARDQRLVREQQIEITTPLELVASSRLSVLLDPGPEPTGVVIATRDQPIASVQTDGTMPSQATAMSSDGRLVLARERDGHYRIDGTIDDQPLRFMIDTGATEIAVSQDFAQRLGYTHGDRVINRTANGTVEGYAFVARQLRVGPYAFQQVRVVALPVLEGDALLGMRVLSGFDLQQSGDTLVLVPVNARSGG